MRQLKLFLIRISNFGVGAGTSYVHQKEISLSNKISLLLLPLNVVGLAMSMARGVDATSMGIGFFLIFLLFVFPLNRYGKSVLTRSGLSIFPQFFLLLPNIFGGIGEVENYFALSYILVGFAIIPLLLFQQKKSWGLLVIALATNLLVVIFYDMLLSWSSINVVDIGLIEDNYLYFKLPQIILWIFIVAAFQFLRKENLNYEKRLRATNRSLEKYANEIQARNEQILAKNESLNEKQLQIEEQASRLERSNFELENSKLELLKTIQKLEEAKNKLLQKEAEAKSIFNALNEHYLVAQYDLNGNLVSMNTRVIELLGVLRQEIFQNVQPIIDQAGNRHGRSQAQDFNRIWEKVKNGESQTIELDFNIGGKLKCMATTFAPLFDLNNKPHRVLAIGQDITELIEKNEKIDLINKELNEKINEISEQNKLLNFQQREIFEKSEELLKQREEIQSINESLEQRVHERTKILEAKNKQLAEYAFINSHILRAPVSTMLGLINLMSYSDLPEEDQKIYAHLVETAKILDNVVFRINNAIDHGFHFDRDYLEPERNFGPAKGP